MKSKLLEILTIISLTLISCHNKELEKCNSNNINITNEHKLPFSEYRNEPCITGRDSARKEAKNGHYTYVISGLVYSSEFQKFYSKFLITNYNVKLLANCDGPPIQPTKLDCYYSEANIVVKAKFGKNFIEKTKAEAKKIYKGKLKPGE